MCRCDRPPRRYLSTPSPWSHLREQRLPGPDWQSEISPLRASRATILLGLAVALAIFGQRGIVSPQASWIPIAAYVLGLAVFGCLNALADRQAGYREQGCTGRRVCARFRANALSA